MRALTPMRELEVSGSGVGESGSVGRVSSRAGPRGRWGGCQNTILSNRETTRHKQQHKSATRDLEVTSWVHTQQYAVGVLIVRTAHDSTTSTVATMRYMHMTGACSNRVKDRHYITPSIAPEKRCRTTSAHQQQGRVSEKLFFPHLI